MIHFKQLRRLAMPLLSAAILLALPAISAAAENAKPEAEHGIPLFAVRLVNLGHGFAITNSMVLTWIVALGIIITSQVAMRNPKAVPEGMQNFWEWLVESLYQFLESVIGHHLVRKTFWFFATIFIFILFSNWVGLIPGVGTVGWGPGEGSLSLSHVDQPLFRGVNADLNMTFAMSCIFFLCWIVWAFQENGVGGFILHLFGPKGDTTGLLKVLMVIVFIIVGLLEVVSIMFRPISLSFRLFGNIYAGENMLEAMATLIKDPAWLRMLMSPLIPVPFYFMELLVGIVQALVFMLLTAVFTLLICQHDEKGTDHHHH